MKQKSIKFLIKIIITVIVVCSFCEFLETREKTVTNKDARTVHASATENEQEQYIPENLDYSEMIKAIKKEEGIEETEEDNPAISDTEQNDKEEFTASNPEEYLQKAKENLSEAIKEESDFIKKQKARKAFRYYKEYLKYYPDSVDGLLGAGAMATYLGLEDDAKNILMQAYAMYPKNPDVHKALGDYSFKFSNYNNAIEYYNLSLSSGNLRDYATNLATAVCYEKLGDAERAKEYYEVSLYLNPESAIAKLRLEMLRAEEEKKQATLEERKLDELDIDELILQSHQFK